MNAIAARERLIEEMKDFSSLLQGCLEYGKNDGKILVVVRDKRDIRVAQEYINRCGRPTKLVPKPDIVIAVDSRVDEIVSGIMYDGRLVIRRT